MKTENMSDNLPPCGVLYCIATEQQITNLLPIVACQPQQVYVLVSEHARQHRWSDHLRLALKTVAPQICCTDIPISPDTDHQPNRLAGLLLSHIDKHASGQTALCWGGGLKIQSLGMWLAFERLNEADRSLYAIITEPSRGRLMWWQHPDEAPAAVAIPQVPIQARLAACGFASKTPVLVLAKNGCVSPNPGFPDWLPEAYDLFCNDQTYRRYCFEWAARANTAKGSATFADLDLKTTAELIETLWKVGLPVPETEKILKSKLGSVAALSKAIQPWKGPLKNLPGAIRKELKVTMTRRILAQFESTVPLPESSRAREFLQRANPGVNLCEPDTTALFPAPDKTRFSLLFELLVGYRAWRWMQAHPGRVTEACMNLECQHQFGKSIFAELDLTVLSASGLMLTIDAKSFIVEPAKQRAQQAGFRAVAGAISTFRFCFPMFGPDIGKPDRRIPRTDWQHQPWFPADLLHQIANYHADVDEKLTDALPLVPFDETDRFEQFLDGKLR